MVAAHEKPAWLEALYVERFFSSCSIHEAAKKNEKNICCLDCCVSICPHCVLSHRSHRLLQIRRYVYHEVVRLEDLEKLIDCSNIQAYTINAAKVVFIKKRPQNRQFKGSGNYCTSCDRSLQEPFFHCSLGCKVDFLINNYNDLSPFLRVCKILQLGPDFFIPQEITNLGEDETTRSTVVDTSDDIEPLSSSSGSDNNNNDDNNHINTFSCTEFVRKKRSGIYVYGRFITNKTTNMAEEDVATSMMSRRKGVPRRSPLC